MVARRARYAHQAPRCRTMARARSSAHHARRRGALRADEQRRVDGGARSEERPATGTTRARDRDRAALSPRRRARPASEGARAGRGADVNRAEELEIMLRVA